MLRRGNKNWQLLGPLKRRGLTQYDKTLRNEEKKLADSLIAHALQTIICNQLFVIFKMAALLINSNRHAKQRDRTHSSLMDRLEFFLARWKSAYRFPPQTKGIIIPSLISVLVCELCWFCRVKARNNERERRAWRPTASRLFLLYYRSVEEL